MLLFGEEPVAQLVEHRPFKARAVGSNPTGFTKTPYQFEYQAFFYFILLNFDIICASGGTGRHTILRGWRPEGHASSSLASRTENIKKHLTFSFFLHIFN